MRHIGSSCRLDRCCHSFRIRNRRSLPPMVDRTDLSCSCCCHRTHLSMAMCVARDAEPTKRAWSMAGAPALGSESAGLPHLEAEAPEQDLEPVANGLEVLQGGCRVGGEVKSAEEEMTLRRRGVVDRFGWGRHDRTISVPSSHRRRQLTRFNLVNAHCYELGFWRRWGCWRSRNG